MQLTGVMSAYQMGVPSWFSLYRVAIKSVTFGSQLSLCFLTDISFLLFGLIAGSSLQQQQQTARFMPGICFSCSHIAGGLCIEILVIIKGVDCDLSSSNWLQT